MNEKQIACIDPGKSLDYPEVLNAPKYIRSLADESSERCTIEPSVKTELICANTTRITVQNKMVWTLGTY